MDAYPEGYAGKFLKVDLSSESVSKEATDSAIATKYVGGVGFGAKLLYDQVVPGVEWNDPANRIIWALGPFNGTALPGSGTFCVISKGPMTDLAASSQANGFFGAYLKTNALDGIVVDGLAKRWCYLYIHDGVAELRNADHLLGKDTWETEEALREELNDRRLSVCCIGPAGENTVRFAAVVANKSHVAGHNGLGAVMGAKKLKAIAVSRSTFMVPVADASRLSSLTREHARMLQEATAKGGMYKWGTAANLPQMPDEGTLPIKNYTTNIFPEYMRFSGEYIRTQFEVKPNPCWACPTHHCETIKVTQGPYTGYEGEEPEYEQLAAFGPVIGQTDPGAATMLSNLGDQLGLEANECGWLIGWVMECYEKGLLTKSDTDGLEMIWGNVEATAALLRKVAYREGCGNLLAEGVKRAAEKLGGEAVQCAIYSQKGASPRGHDHRPRWDEMMDTCFSNTGTVEVGGAYLQPEQLGYPSIPSVRTMHDPWQTPVAIALGNGRRQFEDCLCACRFLYPNLQRTLDILNAITGWEFDKDRAMEVGRRVINYLRVFNLRHGLTKEMEVPSARYGSVPVDGPNKGLAVMPNWDFMRSVYYQNMSWDPDTGKPLPETLRRLGLEHLVADLEDI
ncbi:MAG: hypothetical protein A2Y73_01995 [Chloroflexi bacterium RBG_13_56_8]|nr:MAG: hypothetical protein A2Y73_01995 [Chloroflexi bacterium RBG_13_56_8]